MTRTILLADDSVTIQKVVELTFMDQDYRIVAVSDGNTAIARLSEMRPDLLIADVHMPGADGYEVCRAAKATHPGVPVLLLVGTFEHFDEDAAAAAGAESHLKKPFDSQDLLHQVEALIARASRVAAAAPEVEALAAPEIEAPPVMDLEPPELMEEEVTAVSAAFELEEEPYGELPETPSARSPFPLGSAREARPAAREPVFDDAWGTLTAPSPEPEPAAPLEPPTFEDPWAVTTAPDPVPDAFAAPPPSPVTEPAIEALTVETPAFKEPATEEEEEALTTAQIPAEAPAAAAVGEDGPPAEADFEEPLAGEPEPLAAPVEETGAAASAAPSSTEPPAAEPTSAEPTSGEPESAAEAVEQEPAAAVAGANGLGRPRLSDADVDRIARRVVEMAGDGALREVAWEVVPDLAEVIIKERIRELESQVE